MGLRFRKTISLGKFLRLNLSKSGASVGVGPRGLNVNIGPRGLRRTVGLPGTGLYYQDTSQWPKSPDASAAENASTTSASGVNWKGVALIIMVIAIANYFGSAIRSDGPKRPSVEPTKVEKAATVVRPSSDRKLTHDEVRELQILLRKKGFDPGAPDGVIGPKTRAAVQAFARDRRLNSQDALSLRTLESARDR